MSLKTTLIKSLQYSSMDNESSQHHLTWHCLLPGWDRAVCKPPRQLPWWMPPVTRSTPTYVGFLQYHTTIWWLSARLQYLPSWRTGDTAVLHKTIKMCYALLIFCNHCSQAHPIACLKDEIWCLLRVQNLIYVLALEILQSCTMSLIYCFSNSLYPCIQFGWTAAMGFLQERDINGSVHYAE